MAAKLKQHIRETEGQIVRIEEVLSGFNEDHSSLKDMALSFTGAMAAMGHTMAGDEILKNSFANFAFENFEMAAYKSHLTVADAGGYGAAASALQANLAEEKAMAQWLDENLLSVTTKFLSLRDFSMTYGVRWREHSFRTSVESPQRFPPKEDRMAEKTLNDLFLDTLKDIYFAEKQILKALPKMARAAQAEEGKAGFLQHRDETQGQIERLEQVFELLGKPARGKTCEAIQGIIAEGEEIMEEYKGTVALDAGLISSAQAVEHYEIARYGTLIAWAKQIGLNDAVPLLQENLAEEEATDKKLTQLAETSANVKGKGKKAA